MHYLMMVLPAMVRGREQVDYYLYNSFFNVSIMLHEMFQISMSVSQVTVVVGIIVQTQWGPLSAPVCQAMLWLWMVSHVLVSSAKRLRVITACAP